MPKLRYNTRSTYIERPITPSSKRRARFETSKRIKNLCHGFWGDWSQEWLQAKASSNLTDRPAVTSTSQTAPLIEEETLFQNTWMSSKEKYCHWSWRDLEPRITVLTRASSKSADRSIGHCFYFHALSSIFFVIVIVTGVILTAELVHMR
jgi:hypothetical protein